ncbi:hypothetical protein OG234_13075 [Streptomyces sp. NBC_01420]|uniref:hypothetical protein n=1 Tax=Streptomyces sp. NBC_01420 TaxID=2903858 RepID=UPI003249122E
MEATGIPALDAALVWGGAISVIGAVTTVLWRALRASSHLASRAGQFLDDWYGEEERAGVPARPGVMERLGDLETGLQQVRHEVRPNSGGSLRDAVDLANWRLARLCPDPDPAAGPCGDGEDPGEPPPPAAAH